jgi:DNA processing protein
MSNSYESLRRAICVSGLSPSARFSLTKKVLDDGNWDSTESVIALSELREADEVIETCQRLQILTIPITDERYPRNLAESDAPPSVIYVKGSLTATAPKLSIGVVGARAATVEACNRVSEMAEILALNDVCAVSGLALGIDGAAHRGALRSVQEGATIAVMAHGLDILYPASHNKLAQRIVESGGALVSEYPPATKPLKHHFLARNRIIAGLSSGVVVAEAGSRSGSLVTAQYALDSGRDVFALLAPDGMDQTDGCKTLIEQGAIPVTSAAGILREYKIQVREERPESSGSRKVVIGLGAFMEITGVSFHELLRLELDGIIERTAGNSVKVSAALVGQ